jgi:peptidyl-tRNA hydrolase, PTH1 family
MEHRIELVVGLGNPGPEYQLTRHNVGFWLVDALATAHGGVFERDRKAFGETADITVAGRRIRLLKPGTFMNLSGRAVGGLANFYRIAPESILIAYDELDLPPGRVKLKFGGGGAGHRGMASVIEHIGQQFWRLRLGIGHPGPGQREQVIGYVLGRANAEQEKLILDVIRHTVDAMPMLIESGPEKAKNTLHAIKPAGTEPDTD